MKYLVLSPLDHDGDHYAIGSTVEIGDAEVSGPLLDVRTIGLPGTALPPLAGAALMPLGSEFLPAQIRVASGVIVAQLQAAAAAQVASGLDVTAWNALPVEERERDIIAVLETMQREAAANADAQANAADDAAKAKAGAAKKGAAAKE